MPGRGLFRTAGLALAALAAAGCGSNSTSAPPLRDARVLVYNSVADLLAGDLQENTSRAAALGELRGASSNARLIGLGTTSQAHRNGEIVVLGSAEHPEFMWCDPEYPHPVLSVSQEPLPFLAVAACDPRQQIQVALRPGEDLHAQVAEIASARSLSLAAVSVTGTFRDVSGTIAYNLRKEGTPLTQPGVDVTPYLQPFHALLSAEWRFAGFYTATAEGQSLLSVTGRSLHIHGFRSDRTLGGHLNAATVAEATASLYPLPAPLLRQCDLTVSDLRLSGDTLLFSVTNAGANTVAPVSVRGMAGSRTLFQLLLPRLGAGQTRQLSQTPAWPDAAPRVTVEVDWTNEVRESREDNNAASLE
jgi:predicted DNA-binding protein with PD1-like motif